MEREADRFIDAAMRQQDTMKKVKKRRFSYEEIKRIISINALYRLGSNEETIELINRICASDPTPKTIKSLADEIEKKTKGKTAKEIRVALKSAIQTTCELERRK